MKALFHSPVKRTALLLFLLVSLVYLSNGRVIGSGDTLPARYLPIGLLRYSTFYLDKFPVLYNQKAAKVYSDNGVKPYYLQKRDGHYVSSYTPGPAILALPVYAVPVLAGMSSMSAWVPRLEKLSASLIVAASVAFLFLALCELVEIKWAALIALIYAFATSSFSISSQALWEHGPSQFFLALALYFLVKGGKQSRYLPYAGLALACGVVMRPTDAIIALPIGVYIIHKHYRILWKFLLFSAPPLLLFLLYNHFYMGTLIGYGFATHNRAWEGLILPDLAGLLFSPGRGLFIYSPIVAISVVGMVLGWKQRNIFLQYLSLAPILIVLLYSKWHMWWGGYCYGPRLLADLTPILCFFLYPVIQEVVPMSVNRRRLLLGVFAVLAVLSVGMQSIGTYWYSGKWDAVQQIDHHPERLWNWSDSPFVYYGHYPYWDLGQVAQWLGVRKQIRSIFHGVFGREKSSKIGQPVRLLPGTIRTVQHGPWASLGCRLLSPGIVS